MISEKLGTLYSLILNCPFLLGCSDCPFNNIRELEINERIENLEKLDDFQVDRMLSKHYENYKMNYHTDKL
jgi:hypothetical protein